MLKNEEIRRLPFDLQFFASESEDESVEDFDDFDSEVAKFEEEWVEENPEDIETSVDNPEDIETQDDNPEDIETQDNQNPEDLNPNDDDVHKRNQAFAALRQQAEQNQQWADFVNAIASEAGVTPEELKQRFEERKLEDEASQQGVPVETLKRLTALEQENQTIREQQQAQLFNNQVQAVVEKHQASKEDIDKAFNYMIENGIDPQKTNFEAIYQLAHLDTLVEKKVTEAKQNDLEAKRKRQESAAIPNGTGVVPNNSDTISDEEAEELWKKMDIDFD